MTTLQAQQIHAHLKLTSAFYFVAGRDKAAGLVILDARGQLANEMDSETLVDAITLSVVKDDYFSNLQELASRRAA